MARTADVVGQVGNTLLLGAGFYVGGRPMDKLLKTQAGRLADIAY